MTLGSRLKKARERKRYTQMQVASILGISNGTLSGYERNYRDPDTDTLIKLSELYDVELNWLLGKDNKNKKESAYALSENEFEMIIKEVEDKYKVNLRDDPFVLNTMRDLLDNYAKSKLNQ